jgi:hypothetical protein
VSELRLLYSSKRRPIDRQADIDWKLLKQADAGQFGELISSEDVRSPKRAMILATASR